MAQISEENLLNVIVKDDIKAFNALMEEAQCGSYRLGRFPVLSLLYLYNSKKIISAYEEKFIKITTWEDLREPTSAAKLFADKAGKCLRLYLNEVVSPLEMLLILDKTRRLKRVYPLTRVSGAVKDRLQTIYSVKYSLSVKYEGDNIILDRRPLNRGEKKKIATICLCSFLAVAVAVAAPVTTVALVPKRAEGEVTKLKHIDFSAKKKYTLTKDITVPADYAVEKMNCTIVGGGNKLILERGASLGELSGKISDLVIESTGSPIFTTLSEKAEISGVTVNVNADVVTAENTAFIALTSYGTIEGVTVNISGKISAVADENYEGNGEDLEELTVGGLVLNNSVKYTATSQQVRGVINGCTVNYSAFSLEGVATANAVFGGIVGNNSGVVLGCTVTGEITSDTFDLAGACVLNDYGLSGIVNEANLKQTSGDGWNPVVGGIVIENSYVVEYCKNLGSVTADGKNEATVGGICATNYGRIDNCLSKGSITVKADYAYAGGIFGRSVVAGYMYWGTAEYCISENDISVTAEKTSYAGGIGGFVMEARFVDEDGELVGYYGGGVTDSIFLGSCSDGIEYFGNIVGVCGAHIYETNEYTYLMFIYHNFGGNYYIKNSQSAFGATLSFDGDNKEVFVSSVEDKGAVEKKEEEIKELELYNYILEGFNG